MHAKSLLKLNRVDLSSGFRFVSSESYLHQGHYTVQIYLIRTSDQLIWCQLLSNVIGSGTFYLRALLFLSPQKLVFARSALRCLPSE